MVMTSSARVTVGTINDEIKKLTKPGDRHKRFMGLLDSWGAITYKKAGDTVKWRVQYLEATPEYHDDMDTYTAQRRQRWRPAQLNWHHWRHGELISEFEQLAQQDDKLALFKITKAAIEALSDDFNKHLCAQLFKDGDSVSENNMHGLETMYSDISAIVSGGMVGNPAGSYGGLNMALNHYGAGSFTGTWPDGKGSLEYFFNSPIAVDVTNALWGQSSNTWQYTWRYAMDYAETHVESLHGITPDVWIMTPEMLRKCRMSLIDKERIEITKVPELVKLGFKSLSHNGSELIADHYCTANVAYGIVKDKLEFRNMLPQVVAKKEDTDITTLTDTLLLRTYCNMRFQSPAFFPCLRNITV